MGRHRLHPAIAALVVAAGVVLSAGAAGAQTTPSTTGPPATTTPTTVPVTTPASTLVPTTGGGTTATTVTPATISADDTNDGGGSDIPWVPIAIGVVVLALIVVIIVMIARKRGATHQRVADWRRSAADATAEAGATARLLSQGTPPSGQIAQSLLASLRAFEDLEQSAPDDTNADTAERARRALQTLGMAIDSDYRLRRAQPPADPQQLQRSQESVQNAAGETDRTLRGVYRYFTGAE